MLLIFHKNESWVEHFKCYVKEVNIEAVFLTWREIINSLEINSVIYKNSKSETKLSFKGKLISLSDIQGIYNTLDAPNLNCLNQFIEEDKMYVQSEFFALFLYMLSQHHNVLNPVTHNNFALFPLIPTNLLFNAKNKNLFKIPQYIYSTDIKELLEFGKRKSTCFLNSLYTPVIPEVESFFGEDCFLAVECIGGEPIIVHMIGNNAYATVFYKDGKEIYKCDTELYDSCIRLTKRYRLLMSEILVFRTSENKYCLYYMKTRPDWEKSSHNLDNYWHNILEILSEFYRKKHFYSFITPSLRPKITGQFINTI